MKTWRETAGVVAAWEKCFAAGESVALATLIQIEGSSYRRPGAKLLIRADGGMIGQVSGGCLENDLRERAQRLLAKNEPLEIVHYDTGDDDDTLWGLGLGCDGKLDVLLQRLTPTEHLDTLHTLRSHLAGLEPFVMRTQLDGAERGRIVVTAASSGERTELVSFGSTRTFVDVLEPPPDLVIIGAGDDALPLVESAATAGFRVTVVDHRSAYLTPERFPAAHRLIRARADAPPDSIPRHSRTYVVTKNHALLIDKAWGQFFAATEVPYIGLLGPRSRREEIIASVPAEAHPRMYGPSGLDIKAEGAEQVAVSIIAELLAVMAGRAGGFLRARSGSIHG